MRKKGSTVILVLTVMIFAIVMTLAALAVYMRANDYRITKGAPEEPAEENTEEPATETTETVVEDEYDKLKEIDTRIQDSYLGEYERDAQMDQVYRAMIDSLGDKYSRYLDQDELKQLQNDISNSFTGTGIVFIEGEESGTYSITEVVPGGPADTAGIKEGDVILTVDGKEQQDVEAMMEALKGNPGSQVKLKVLRDEEELEISVIRGNIRSSSIESKKVDGEDSLGYIRIKSFGEDTGEQFDAAISNFEGDKIKGIILDIRDNPGGVFEEGVAVADRILPEQLVAYTVDKNGNRENYNSDSKKLNMPVVLLVNENTASTGEMLAAALKGSDNCTLIGTTTYGKGLIQGTYTYDDGTAVNLTIKEFFGPDDQKIDESGVTPDITVQEGAQKDKDPQMDKAVEVLKDAV